MHCIALYNYCSYGFIFNKYLTKVGFYCTEVMELRLTDASANISTTFNLTNRAACGCLPGCFAVDYTTSLTSSKLTDKIDKSKMEYLTDKDPKYFT